MSARSCLECSEPATVWCSTCKAAVCDSDLQHCVEFGHRWNEIGPEGQGAPGGTS